MQDRDEPAAPKASGMQDSDEPAALESVRDGGPSPGTETSLQCQKRPGRRSTPAHARSHAPLINTILGLAERRFSSAPASPSAAAAPTAPAGVCAVGAGLLGRARPHASALVWHTPHRSPTSARRVGSAATPSCQRRAHGTCRSRRASTEGCNSLGVAFREPCSSRASHATGRPLRTSRPAFSRWAR